MILRAVTFHMIHHALILFLIILAYIHQGSANIVDYETSTRETLEEVAIEVFSKSQTSCINSEDWKFSEDMSIGCLNVKLSESSRRLELCQINEVHTHCPISCGKCCVDDPNFEIEVNNLNGTTAFKSCDWLGTSIRSKLEWWCNVRSKGKLIREGCPQSCNWCQSDDFGQIANTSNSSSKMMLSSTPSFLTPDSSPFPTSIPTLSPTTMQPTLSPSSQPSASPTMRPTSSPSKSPTLSPTVQPSLSPSIQPSASPTMRPTSSPTKSPTPTFSPTNHPTSSPTRLPTQSPTEKKPNLIMILTDEHNYRTLSCYRDYWASKVGAVDTDVWGDLRLDTPNIDKLASQGALFTNFYTVAPLCTPSRASFMSGKYPSFTGGADRNHGKMDNKINTFSKVLKNEMNYYTGYFGKWHLDGENTPGWGDNGRWMGFDENKYRWNRGHYKYIDEVNGEMVGYTINDEWRFKNREVQHYTTDYLMDRGIDFIKRSVANKDPFAMVLSIPDPHGPNHNRPQYRDLYTDLHFQIPETAAAALKYDPAAPGFNWVDAYNLQIKDADEFIEKEENSKTWQKYMQQYYGMVKCIDDNVGKLLFALQDAGIDEETIVVFTSDHGDLLMEHARQNKGQPYETSAGIPFLVRFPGVIPAGKVVETAYSSVDFAPTILSLMGASTWNMGFHGENRAWELQNSNMTPNDTEKIIFSMDTGNFPGWAMAQMGKYKLVLSKGDGPWLFDILRNPAETRNYIKSSWHVDIKKKLQDALVEALFSLKIPLTWFADAIYIDEPNCFDNKDVLHLDNGRLLTCRDIGVTINGQKCKKTKIQKHCPVTCKSCCLDTVGRMIVDAQLYNSCSALKDKCNMMKVQTFCPQTCEIC